MARSTDQQRGIDFEDRVADIMGLSKQPGSGNKFYAKNDCVGYGLSISCKSQYKLSWKQILEYLCESIDNSYQTGNIPILALDGLGSADIAIIRLEDLVKMLSNKIKIENSVQSKGVTKREKADIPLMLR